MKILTAQQVKVADAATVSTKNITSLELMEHAAMQCFNYIKNNFDVYNSEIKVFCGVGNNGGDGLVIARLLADINVNVSCFIVHFSENQSKDFKLNYERLRKYKNVECIDIKDSFKIPILSNTDLIIDAIFGIGLSKSPKGIAKKIIQHINNSNALTISIDMPSGLFAEYTVEDKEAVIKADMVLTFQTPKLALLLPDNSTFSKSFEVIDIDLDNNFINALDVKNLYLTVDFVKNLYRKRTKFQHKGSFGHSLLIGGSYGKIGAIVLASKAALKIGSGLVSSYIPKCGYQILQTTIPEVMVEVDNENLLQFFNVETHATGIGIGPGMGCNEKTAEGFINFIETYNKPLVLDADALNILSVRQDKFASIPENSVLTPHPKEFERLVGSWKNDYEKLNKLKDFSSKYKVVVVLKGAHTVVASNGFMYFNSTGNVALATAGSGDVLMGIITGLIAQGYVTLEAAILGVYIHGKTADIYTQKYPVETFTASELIELIPDALTETFYAKKNHA